MSERWRVVTTAIVERIYYVNAGDPKAAEEASTILAAQIETDVSEETLSICPAEGRAMSDLPVFVPRDMWARRGAKELGKFVDQLDIYDHVFVPPGDWVPVTVDELVELGAVKMLTLHKEIH